MQILESSMLGLRTSRMVFRSPKSAVLVTLYPMVHVGEEQFYKDTYDEAFAHDVVLVEGIGSSRGRSAVGRNLTRSYRWMDFEKLGLVRQPKAPPQESVSARIVRADLAVEEFHQEWRKVSFALRAAFFITAPLCGLYRRFYATRESLARNMFLEDRFSADEILSWSPEFEPVNRSVIDARDQRLIECLISELEGANGAQRIAVVYGAKHMRAVLRELTRRRFYCSEASWRTIFSI